MNALKWYSQQNSIILSTPKIMSFWLLHQPTVNEFACSGIRSSSGNKIIKVPGSYVIYTYWFQIEGYRTHRVPVSWMVCVNETKDRFVIKSVYHSCTQCRISIWTYFDSSLIKMNDSNRLMKSTDSVYHQRIPRSVKIPIQRRQIGNQALAQGLLQR